MPIAPYLKKNDKIAIVSTARKISSAEIDAAAALAESWGLEVVLGKSIDAEFNQFAGNDKLRLEDFQYAINDDSIKAIWCARGGYGTTRIIDDIDFRNFMKNPKWICGFSDITVLHNHIHTLCATPTIHSMMCINAAETSDEMLASAETLRQCLMGERIKYNFSAHKLNRRGSAMSEIIGGNLSLIYSLASTQSDIDTTGKILLIEDIDEQLYHVDRMMLQLKRSGKLDNLAGLIVGGFTDMKDNTVPYGKTAEEIIAEHVSEFDYPVCYNFPIGHQKTNMAIKLGCKGLLTILEKEVNFNQS
jgi:muramoyltetrapeptide carboxypeptidase